MELHSKVEAPFLPDADQATVMRMALQALPENEWMMVDADLPQFVQHKQEQEKLNFDRVYQQLPQSQAAQAEFNKLLQAHLITHHAYGHADSSLIHKPTGLNWDAKATDLWSSSLWIEEDICLLQAQGDEYVLTAASVCSPSNWKMEEKIGRSVDVIHDPVPGYHDAMGAKVNRLLRGIKAGKAVQRLNWSIQPGAELFWREDLKTHDKLEEKFWRVERQTLLRLPKTQAIVFGIRVFMHSFQRMSQYPQFESDIASILSRLPGEQKTYKNLA